MSDLARQAEIGILRYLMVHPHARDTVEGIEKWWLPGYRPYGMATLLVALRRLQDRQLIRVWKFVSAKPVYGRSADPQSLKEYLQGRDMAGHRGWDLPPRMANSP